MHTPLAGRMGDEEARMFCAHCTRPTESSPCAHCGEQPLLDGRYQLHDRLGRGASGTTWLASDPEGQQVAIKSITLEDAEGPKERELVEREVRVLRELSHPGIPAYVEHLVVGERGDAVLWLVQELVPGRSLAEEQADHRYNPKEVLAIMAELAGVLAYLHELAPPVIHRDIKPANVMRRPDGGLVLIDFGSVRDVAKGSIGGSTVAGTFGYMAPEQFAGDAEPRSDLYGLGALAVALLTRKEPQSLSDHANRLQWANHTQVPSGVHDLVNRLVEPELERRAPSAAWVKQRAELLLGSDERTTVARPEPAEVVEQALERKPRDLRWWLLAAGMFLCVGAVPVALSMEGYRWYQRQLASDPVVRLPSPPPDSPRSEQPLMQRPGADADQTDRRPLQRIVSTLGEDPGIQGCVAQHQRDNPGQMVQLEVLIEPPNEITDTSVGPSSLANSELARCLERAALRVALHGVELERAGSVTLAFD
jgi:serine/threonine protein kinase